ncbi:hypothetical protein GRN51_320 [Salmonella phage GRNsp51]|uniref:Uncharacterized protein n=1 Tax=Salmonella phage GRNsp51 TaxID=2948587 RepID=A0A9E7LHC2_9CAUD|nr:hypothetical protein GRN51_320 [Salmonella phage GRNsp51]
MQTVMIIGVVLLFAVVFWAFSGTDPDCDGNYD